MFWQWASHCLLCFYIYKFKSYKKTKQNSLSRDAHLYNVLRAFLRDGCTRRTGRTESRAAGPCQKAGGVVLSPASRTVSSPPGSGSSYSDSSSPCVEPCPSQSGENAPGLTACSSFHRPVSTFKIPLATIMHTVRVGMNFFFFFCKTNSSMCGFWRAVSMAYSVVVRVVRVFTWLLENYHIIT